MEDVPNGLGLLVRVIRVGGSGAASLIRPRLPERPGPGRSSICRRQALLHIRKSAVQAGAEGIRGKSMGSRLVAD